MTDFQDHLNEISAEPRQESLVNTLKEVTLSDIGVFVVGAAVTAVALPFEVAKAAIDRRRHPELYTFDQQ